MGQGNPIRFSDLFNFQDNSDVKSATEMIGELNASYKQFIETVMGSNFSNLTNQTKEIANSTKSLVDQIAATTYSTKEGQNALIAYTDAMAQQEKAVKNLVDAKKGLKDVEKLATDSVAGLKEEYKRLQAEYDKLSPANANHAAQMKTLSMAAQDTKEKITQLTTAFKTTTDVVKIAQNSYASLDAENKRLIISLKAMEGGMNQNNTAANALRDQIFKNTQALKEFDAQINIHNRNVGNYLGDIQKAAQIRKEMEMLKSSGQEGSVTYGNLNSTLTTLTSSLGGTGTQLTMVTSEMNRLAEAGRMDSVEFERLSVLAKQLQAEMRGVGTSIHEGITEAAEKGVEQLKELFIAFFVLNEVINFFEGIKEEVEKAERATVQLRNTLESFGKGEELEGIEAKVEKLREEFKYLGEAELNTAFSKLITYAKLSEEQIDQLLPVIINYAAKQNETIEQSTATFLKALEGQGRGLKELGIDVKDGGNEIERFGIIMNQLGPKVAGAAAAFEDSDSGKIAGFTRKIKDLQKQIGEFMLPILAALASALMILPLGPITVALGLLTAAMIAQYTYTKLTTEGTVLYNIVQRAKVGWDALATTSQIAYTQALVLFTGETKAATAAQLAFNAAEMANPLTAVIAVIAIGAAALVAYAASTRNATKAVHEKAEAELRELNAKKALNEVQLIANRNVADEIAAVNKLVDIIKHHSNTLDERNKALEKLVALNEKNLSGLTLQNIETEKGIAILDRYIKKLEETAYAEALESKLLELEKERVENKLNKPKEIAQYKPDTRGEDPAMVAQQQKQIASMNKIGQNIYEEKDKAIQDKIDAVLNEIKDHPNPNTHNNSTYEGGADHSAQEARKAFEQRLKDAESFYTRWADIVKLGYEKGQKLDIDEIAMENANLTMARDLYRQRLQILEDYHKGAGKDDKKYLEDKTAIEHDLALAEIKGAQALRKIQEASDKKNAEALKNLDAYIDRLRKGRQELDEISEELGKEKKYHDEDLKDAKKTSPILAMFGLGSANDDFDKQISDIDRQIDKASAKNKKLKEALANENNASSVFGRATDPEKLNGLQKQLGQSEIDVEAANSKKKIAIAEKEAAGKEAVWNKSYELGTTLANNFFKHQQDLIESQMSAMQASADFEMNLAGNNAAARQRISQQLHDKMLALKRKEAEAEREQGLFSVAISTAMGIAKALADYEWPYDMVVAAIVGGLGLAQAAAITSKPLPNYFVGRGMGKDEFARINEKGFELIERDGQLRVEGGGKETTTFLHASDKVHTHEQSLKILSQSNEDITTKDKWLNDLLKGTGAVIKKEENQKREVAKIVVTNMLSKSDMRDAMSDAIKSMPPVVVKLPAKGVSDRLFRVQERNGL